MNPGVNKFVDRDHEREYFTSENALKCIRDRENIALEVLRVSLSSFGSSTSSSSSSSRRSSSSRSSSSTSTSSSTDSYVFPMACCPVDYN